MCRAVSLLQNRALIYNKDMTDINSLKKKKKLHVFLLIMTHTFGVCVFLPRDHVQHSQTAARLYDLHVIEKPSAVR